APFFAIWNMQATELYRTPPENRAVTPNDRLTAWPPDPGVKTVSDWLRKDVERSLHQRAKQLLDEAWAQHVEVSKALTIDASVFVDRVAQQISRLRELIRPALSAKLAQEAALRKRIHALAAAQ